MDSNITDHVVDIASKNGNVEMIDWWARRCAERGLKFKYSTQSVWWTRKIQMINWWIQYFTKHNKRFKRVNISTYAKVNGRSIIFEWQGLIMYSPV